MKKLVLFAFCLCSVMAFAQDEVSLVVSADGATKTQAIDNALRSAIEQTYGTFVSANTKILNDELVKDEIATVSSGNIKKYKEVAVVTLPNGNTSVTLNVTVSLKKLIKYAQSKGSECEFAGATFGANKRMYDFNKRNEQIVIQNMMRQLDALRPVYDFEIEVSDPVMCADGKTATIEMQVTAKSNKTTIIFNNLIKETILSLAMTEAQVKPMMEAGFTFEKYIINFGKRSGFFYTKGQHWQKNPKTKKNELVDSYSFKQKDDNVYYFYNRLQDSVSRYVLDALLDFSIKDNEGGTYNSTIQYYNWNFGNMGHILPHGNHYYYDSYGRFFEYYGNCPIVVIFSDNIQGITPILTFSVPIESLEKISKIQVVPAKEERTNDWKAVGGDWRNYPTIKTQYNKQ